MSHEPQRSKLVRIALENRDWRSLNNLRAKWYDQFDHKWYKFGPHFWDEV